ncbi:hypothetical protein GCM10020254_50280 [Streptomyces goshikiensis]
MVVVAVAVAVAVAFSAVADIDNTPRFGTNASVLSPASHIPTKMRATICDAPALANGLQLGIILERLKTL